MTNELAIGIRAPHELLTGPIENVATFAGAVDASGLSHVFVGDHVSFRGGQGYDGLVQAALLVALTRRVEVWTAVYLLPLRPPVAAARQILTLAGAAEGRFTFGVGMGGDDPAEYAACGLGTRGRGKRMDEAPARGDG